MSVHTFTGMTTGILQVIEEREVIVLNHEVISNDQRSFTHGDAGLLAFNCFIKAVERTAGKILCTVVSVDNAKENCLPGGAFFALTPADFLTISVVPNTNEANELCVAMQVKQRRYNDKFWHRVRDAERSVNFWPDD